jgi:hypothetical protein
MNEIRENDPKREEKLQKRREKMKEKLDTLVYQFKERNSNNTNVPEFLNSDSDDEDGDEDIDEDGEEDGETGAPVPQTGEVHEQRKKDFVKFAKSQEGRIVRVIYLFMLGTH